MKTLLSITLSLLCFSVGLKAEDRRLLAEERDTLWNTVDNLHKTDNIVQLLDSLAFLQKHYEKEGDALRLLNVQIVFARYHRLRSREFKQADAILYNAKHKAKNIDLNHALWIDFFEEWGKLNEVARDYPLAISYYKQALAKETFKPKRAELYRFIGRTYLKKGDFDNAFIYFKQSIKSSNIGDENWINANNNMAVAYSRKKQLDKALQVHIDVLAERNKKIDNGRDIGISHLNIAGVLLKMNRYKEALSNMDSFFVHYSYINTLSLDASGMKGHIARKKYEQSKKSKDLNIAVESFQRAFRMADSLRIRYLAADTDLNLAASVDEFMEDALWIAAESKDVALALSFVEKSRSLQLLDNLKKIKAEEFALPEEFQELERVLLKKIARMEDLAEDSSDVQKMKYLDSLVAYKHQHLKLITQLEKDFPQYYQLKYDTTTIKVEDIQKRLVEEQAFVSYFMAENALFAVVVEKEDSRILHLEYAEDFHEAAIQQFNRQAGELNGDSSQSVVDSFYILGHSLYGKLLEPLFKGEIPQKLIIAPHGILEFFPFDALIVQKPIAGENRPPFLIDSHQVSLAYSASVLFHKNENRKKAKQLFLGVAPTYFEQMTTLSKSQEEINAILKSVGSGDILFTENATKEQLLSKIGNYQFIYISTHSAGGNNPFLALYGNDSLMLKEIYNAQLHADMIVLSSCESGQGKQLIGEGAMSLARGFSYAGAASSVTTLWSVTETTTKQLMESFYRFLKEGKTKGEALRLAKLAYLKTASAHKAFPYYWAAPVYFGLDGKVEFKTTNYWSWLLGIGFLGMIGLLFGRFGLFRH